MTQTIRILLLVALVSVASCSGGDADSPQKAKGDTPIRYVTCGAGGTSCFVVARFKDLDSCESHKQWAYMLCDQVTEPGKMICTQDQGPRVGVAYCTL